MSINDDTDLHDPDDMFKDTRMSIGDHIEDLRTHLLRALKGFVIGMLLGLWPLGPWLLDIIKKPVEDQLNAFQKRKLSTEYEEAKRQVTNKNLELRTIRVQIRVNRQDLLDDLNRKPRQPRVLDN